MHTICLNTSNEIDAVWNILYGAACEKHVQMSCKVSKKSYLVTLLYCCPVLGLSWEETGVTESRSWCFFNMKSSILAYNTCFTLSCKPAIALFKYRAMTEQSRSLLKTVLCCKKSSRSCLSQYDVGFKAGQIEQTVSWQFCRCWSFLCKHWFWNHYLSKLSRITI